MWWLQRCSRRCNARELYRQNSDRDDQNGATRKNTPIRTTKNKPIRRRTPSRYSFLAIGGHARNLFSPRRNHNRNDRSRVIDSSLYSYSRLRAPPRLAFFPHHRLDNSSPQTGPAEEDPLNDDDFFSRVGNYMADFFTPYNWKYDPFYCELQVLLISAGGLPATDVKWGGASSSQEGFCDPYVTISIVKGVPLGRQPKFERQTAYVIQGKTVYLYEQCGTRGQLPQDGLLGSREGSWDHLSMSCDVGSNHRISGMSARGFMSQ